MRRAARDVAPGEWVVLLPPGPAPVPPRAGAEPGRAPLPRPPRPRRGRARPIPVWIRAVFGLWNNTPPFVHVLNSAGLRACGITRDTPPPTSTVEIERDAATGDLTGRILERHLWPAAEFTLLRAAPRFTREVRVRALREAMRLSAAAGTTSVFEGHGVAAEVARGLPARSTTRASRPCGPTSRSACRPGGRSARWRRCWPTGRTGPAAAAPATTWLTVGGVYLEYGGHAEVAAAQPGRVAVHGLGGLHRPVQRPGRRTAPCAAWPRATGCAWRPSALDGDRRGAQRLGGGGARASDPATCAGCSSTAARWSRRATTRAWRGWAAW